VTNSSVKYPVLVFIHGIFSILKSKSNKCYIFPTKLHIGAAFVSGNSNMYTGARLLNRDIVIVTFNYRLGVFGNLTYIATFYESTYYARFYRVFQLGDDSSTRKCCLIRRLNSAKMGAKVCAILQIHILCFQNFINFIYADISIISMEMLRP
jgi:hypothetical protein